VFLLLNQSLDLRLEHNSPEISSPFFAVSLMRSVG
jgi:hypothetical protein